MPSHVALRRSSRMTAVVGGSAILAGVVLCAYAIGGRDYDRLGWGILGLFGLGGGVLALGLAAVLSGMATRQEPDATPRLRSAGAIVLAGGWCILAPVLLPIVFLPLRIFAPTLGGLEYVAGFGSIGPLALLGAVLVLVGQAQATAARKAKPPPAPPEGPY